MNPEKDLYLEILNDDNHGLSTLRSVVVGKRPEWGSPEHDVYLRSVGRVCVKHLGRLIAACRGGCAANEANGMLAWLREHEPDVVLSEAEALTLCHRWDREHWQAAEAWCSLVEVCSTTLTEVCRPTALLAKVNWLRHLHQEAWMVSFGPMIAEGLSLKKKALSVEWRIVDKEENEHGYPLVWGVMANLNAEAHSAEFVSADGKRVLSVVLMKKSGDQILKAAACERIGTKWSRWRVAKAKLARMLARWGLMVPSRTEARVGWVCLRAGIQEVKLGYEWEWGMPEWLETMQFDPTPLEVWRHCNDWCVRLRFEQGKVMASDRRGYGVELETDTGWVSVARLRAETWPDASVMEDEDSDF